MSSINSFSSEIKQILEKYGEEVQKTVSECIEQEAPKVVKELKKTSPKNTGAYAKGWKKKIEKDRLNGIKATAYNEDHYRLTHLLEFGHALRSGGRTRAFPHIKPAQDKDEKEIIREIEERLS